VPGVADPGRRFGDRVENLLDALGHAGRLGATLPSGRGLGGAGQVKQVVAFGLVKLQRSG
jgi:hypothetical protein